MLRRRFLLGALAVPVVLVLPGCAARYADRAQTFADEVLPGKLRFLEVVNDVGGPVPVPTRTAIYRVVDDPDAFVSLDAFDAATLRTAYALSLRAAAEMRLLAEAMFAAGFDIQGFSHTVKEDTVGLFCYLRSDVSEETMSTVESDLDNALVAWLSSRSTTTDPNVTGTVASVGIGLIRPEDSAQLPGLTADQPFMRRLNHKKRNDALSGAAVASTSVYADADGNFPPVANRMKPNPGTVTAQGGEAAARAAAGDWLTTRRPDLMLAGEDLLARRLEPGSLNRARIYFRTSRANSTDRVPTHYVAVTFVLGSRQISDLTLLERPKNGWPSPLEPKL